MSNPYGLPLTSEQEVRKEVVLQLLRNGRPGRSIETEADRLTNHILNGKKDDPKTVKKIKVFLPPDQELEAQAHLLEDSSILVEFQNPEIAEALFANFDLYGLSFTYTVDTTKDN